MESLIGSLTLYAPGGQSQHAESVCVCDVCVCMCQGACDSWEKERRWCRSGVEAFLLDAAAAHHANIRGVTDAEEDHDMCK